MKTKILLVILSIFFVFSKAESQITPYIPIEFKNLNPVWMHVSIDSTLIDSDKYDGMTHLSFIEDYPPVHLVDNDNLYIVSNTRIRRNLENEGVLIEKLNLKTGKTIWTNHIDLRNNDRMEYAESIYKNKNDNVVIVTDRKIKKTGDSFGHIDYGDTALISILNYNDLNGELISHDYPDSLDTNSIRIRYSAINSTILFPLKNDSFLYIKNNNGVSIEQFLIDKSGHLLSEPMKDSVVYDDYFNPDSVLRELRCRMVKISEDSLLELDFLYNRNEVIYHKYNPDFKKQAKLTLYDKNLKIKKVMKIDSLLPKRYDFLRLKNADKNHIYLDGRYQRHYVKRDTYFYYIFNWNGEIERQFTSVYNGEYISFKTTFLEKEKEFLAVGISEDWLKLKFFKTNHNEGLFLIKEFYFKNNGRVFTPTYIEQLDNGDILLKGYNRIKDKPQYPLWYTWMRIKAEDLGLQGTSTRDISGLYNKLSLSPNPAKDILKIQSENIKINKIKMYDMLGRLVMDKNVPNENTYTVNVASLLPGIYSVKAIGKEKYVESGIFVKK